MNKTSRIWLIIILGFAVLYYFFNPSVERFFPSCPFYTATGWQCPGCGSQRAIHELLHFNFIEAFQYNALLVLFVPYVLAYFVFEIKSVKDRWMEEKKYIYGKKAFIVIGCLVVLFFIVRNLM